MQKEFLDGRVLVKTGDITLEDVDAIVNAANPTLLGGGGVDAAIHSRGGTAIYDECKRIRDTDYPDGLPTGKAVITTGGIMTARFVIHTVGPIYGQNDGDDARLLKAAYINSLEIAAVNGLRTIAFPSISTGAYRYPRSEAARIVSEAIKEWLASNETVEQVRLVFFSRPDADKFIENAQF